MDINTYQVLKGSNYLNGLGLEAKLQINVEDIKNTTKNTLNDYMKIVEIGNRAMSSSTFSKWVISN